MKKNQSRGRFIVIDGTDGSGKATQVGLLAERLKTEGRKVKAIDFPRYYNNFFGKFIGECLAGDYGNFLEVNPYIASVLYAADRFESAGQINKWLADGNIVLADRYVSSNQIHQGAKLKNADERKKFLAWLEKMEFGVLKIPKPDAIIYLDVPIEVTCRLLKEKEKSKKREYLKGRKDAHENSLKHLISARASALDLVESYNNWINIDCCKNDQMMSKKDISDIIFKKTKPLI